MTKVNTFDHIFQELELGHNLNSTLTEVNFWLKIVEFYYEVFHELRNSPLKRKGNMKRFITFFLWSFHKFLQQTFSNMPWIKLMKDILKPFVCSHQFFFIPVCLYVEITRTGRSMTFKMSKIQRTKASFFIATELLTS